MSKLTPAREHRACLLSYDTEDLFTLTPPPLRYLAEGVVVRDALNLLAAREKTGKSLLALGLALAIAKGDESYAGLRVQPGRVVYLDAENGIGETHRRIRRLSEMPCPADRFRYLALGEQPFRLDDPDALGVLDEVVAAYAPDLIVFDSFRSLWTGDENNPRECARVLDPLRNFLRARSTAGLLLHHANAHGDLRGSTGIPASVENLCKLTAKARGLRQLVQLPSRFGQALERPVGYRMTPRSADPLAPLDFVSVDVAAEPASDGAPLDLEGRVLRLLTDGCPRKGRAVARDLGRDPTSRGARNAVAALVRRGTVRETDEGYVLAQPVAA